MRLLIVTMPEAAITIAISPHLSLPDLGLALDPHVPQPFAFISHAHADHFARHERILCSTQTAHLLHRRFRIPLDRLRPLNYDTPLTLHGHLLRILPAGHIFGSAMLHVTRQSDRATFLYTGDFKLRESRTAETAQLLQADTLAIETTFGLPNYVFPSKQEIESAILHFIHATLDDGDIPVLLGYSLGKAQEALALLQAHDIPVCVQKQVHEMTLACIETGLPLTPPPLFDKAPTPSHAIIAPPNAVRSKALHAIKNRRVAMLSGWALNPNARYRYQTDEAFPLSDHADFPALLETVRRVSPKRVLTLHGFTREFAATLRHHGFEAWSIHGDDQIELPFAHLPPAITSARKPKNRPLPSHPITQLAQLLNNIAATSSRLRKIQLLASYLKALHPDELALASSFLSGRLLTEERSLSLGTAIIRQALLEVTGIPLPRYREISQTTADPARTTRLLLEQYPSSSQFNGPQTLHELRKHFQNLADQPGTLAKISTLASLLKTLHPIEAELVVRLLTGDLRAGLKAALLEDAIAVAFSAELSLIRRAHMLTGDLATTAILAKNNRLAEATLRPHTAISPMLASPEPSAAAILQRLNHETIHLEPKYDGIRAQLHFTKGKATLFSRDLRSLNEEFPELLTAAQHLPSPCILDGELIAFAEGRQLTFFDLQKRLGRKRHQGDLFLGETVPVRFIAFDILWLNDTDLLETSYLKRRQQLAALTLPSPFHRIELFTAENETEITTHFKRALQQGHEGLIAKNPTSPYTPGRRGKSWLKLKGVMPTLDCVVIAAQQGHGRRAAVLSDYTFAVRDEISNELLTLGKAYSGLTDEEIEELTVHFKQTTLRVTRRVHTVEPTIVLEIAFDSINTSKRHNSGLALRFPRIKAIRRDKSVAEIDTLQTTLAMRKANSIQNSQ